MNEKVLIVDDEKSIVDPIAYALKKEGYIVNTAYDGEAALAQYLSFVPDVLILDVMMPKMDGYSVLRKLYDRGNIGIIVLTAKDDIVNKVLGLELGADDYITKPFDMRELLARVKTLLRRTAKHTEDARHNNDIMELQGLKIEFIKRKVIADGNILELTPKEFDLLALLVSNPERVYTREQLLDLIWGVDYIGGTRTVDIHIQRVRKKVGGNYQHILQTVHGVGYKAIWE